MVRSPPRSTLFPYPTPFRSNTAIDDTAAGRITLASLTRTAGEDVGAWTILTGTAGGTAIGNYTPTVNTNAHVLNIAPRSEKHTPELQSLRTFVCSLLLEKTN